MNSLPYIPAVSHLSPWITRILGHNPGPKTLQGTNSYLIGSPTLGRILIDTTSYGHGLMSYINHLKSELSHCITHNPLLGIVITHWHPDHTQGIHAVLDMVDQSHSSTSITVKLSVYKHTGGPDLSAKGFFNGSLTNLSDNQLIRIPIDDGHLELRCVFTPGHADDHSCFVLSKDSQVLGLFTGDLILGHGSTTIQHLPFYMNSLSKLEHVVPEISPDSTLIFYPAHGLQLEDGRKAIDDYRKNRMDRIRKVTEFINNNPPETWYSENEIFQHVYPGLSPKLRDAALINLRHYIFWVAAHGISSQITAPLQLTCRKSTGLKSYVSVDEFHLQLESIADNAYDSINDEMRGYWEWKWSH